MNVGLAAVCRAVMVLALGASGLAEPARAQSTAPDLAPPPSCAAVTDRAMAIDLQSANAQAQRASVTEQLRLLDESTALWKQAVELCSGRAKERAQRNLVDSQKSRGEVGVLQGAGERCLASQKDATALEELARRVLGERRFADAAGLFRRAETQWELAAERCAGGPQKTALQRRELAETDAHNAEHCAPRFQLALESTQRLRNTGAAMTPAERQTQSQLAETQWRLAIPQCRGAAQDVARSQVQTLARERGTPWVATLPPSGDELGLPPTNDADRRAPPVAAVGPAAAPTAAAVAASAVTTVRTATVAPSPPTPAAPVAPMAVVPAVDVTVDGGARFVGAFALDAGGRTYSGRGRVIWPQGESYDGALVGGRRHGAGEFVWASGQRYKGDWVDDRPHGQGEWRFANGNVYLGTVVNGQPQGKGRLAYASGDVYEGELNQGEPDGQGVYVWTSGQRYTGPWVKGVATGYGTMVFANGNRYEGELADGKPHGRGKMAYATGEVYGGQFNQGEPEGEGVQTWANGQRYQGQWVRGVAQGRASMQFANGNFYEGDVAKGLPHGNGTMRFAGGDLYQGQFAQGVPDGEGRFTWKNGDHYVGRWKAGLREGQGVMQWSGGDRWEGIFRADAQTEQGTLTRATKP